MGLVAAIVISENIPTLLRGSFRPRRIGDVTWLFYSIEDVNVGKVGLETSNFPNGVASIHALEIYRTHRGKNLARQMLSDLDALLHLMRSLELTWCVNLPFYMI